MLLMMPIQKRRFNNANLKAVMRQLSRWYDVEVAYQNTVTKHFGGIISRSVTLSKVLNMLEQTGAVKFTVEGKKVTVKT